MPRFGAHQSIAGGYHKAVEIGVKTGCNLIQIFTKNTNQWRGKPITPEEAARFCEAVASSGVECVLAHDSYLINLASPVDELWKKSIDAAIDEVQRAAVLGIPWVVAHPGAFTTSSEEEGIHRIIAALDEVIAKTGQCSMPHPRPLSRIREGKEEADGKGTVPKAFTGILLETTAGQGSTLGWRFEQLAAILNGVKDNSRLGVCFDTCHVFAAGYKLSPEADYKATMKQFDKIVGLKQIRAFHVNDSVKDCGSRVDRHAHIGKGCIGPEAFGFLVRDPRFKKVPMVLETPKGTEGDEDCDAINLRLLRELAGTKKEKPAKTPLKRNEPK